MLSAEQLGARTSNLVRGQMILAAAAFALSLLWNSDAWAFKPERHERYALEAAAAYTSCTRDRADALGPRFGERIEVDCQGTCVALDDRAFHEFFRPGYDRMTADTVLLFFYLDSMLRRRAAG